VFWGGGAERIALMGDVRSSYEIFVCKLKEKIWVEYLCLYGRLVLNTEIVKKYGWRGTLDSTSLG
jgi:hypothetical protein